MKHVIGLMSGTSWDGVDAALIETDGEAQIRALAGVERRYVDEERAVLHAAVEAALAWGFVGDEPDFTAAEAVLTRTHADLIELANDWAKLIVARDPELTEDTGQALRHLLYLFDQDTGIRLLKSG